MLQHLDGNGAHLFLVESSHAGISLGEAHCLVLALDVDAAEVAVEPCSVVHAKQHPVYVDKHKLESAVFVAAIEDVALREVLVVNAFLV